MQKSGLKTRGHHAIFWVLEVKRSKILQKLNILGCLCLHYWFHFFMAFLARKLMYIIYIWFYFVPGSFFGQDCLLNLTILGVYAKRWPKCARISRQKLMQHKIWSIMIFLILAVRKLFHRNDFKWKKKWRCGATFWKNGSFTCRT